MTSVNNVNSKVKQQAEGARCRLYDLLDVGGHGLLISSILKVTEKSPKLRNYTELHQLMDEHVRPLLYNEGEGCLVPVEHLVAMRSKDCRPSQRLRGKDTFRPEDHLRPAAPAGDDADNAMAYSRKLTKFGYRKVCWRLDQRGTVGETILHLCLLGKSQAHIELAKQLLEHFPNLVNDIYQQDEYYGENVLHMAIVNEDPNMVKYLLDHGVNYHERCFGNFFSPDDQKSSRRDNIRHEWVDVTKTTNYQGNAYWGEYPLSFAACLNQEECVRLLVNRGADPNKQDTNGNTVLHMLVIYNKIPMFDVMLELGARLDIKNVTGLTPLTLAARLARNEMFLHILQTTRQMQWTYGEVSCAAYPLVDFDTVEPSNGALNTNSVLNLIVFGDQQSHLDMLDGIVSDILMDKWTAFVRQSYVKNFMMFVVYCLLMIIIFVLRPGSDKAEGGSEQSAHRAERSANASHSDVDTEVTEAPLVVDNCYLLRYDGPSSVVRWVCEVLVMVASCGYVSMALLDVAHHGVASYVRLVRQNAAKAMFHLACLLNICMIVPRITCSTQQEDQMAVISILLSCQYMLFFCRGIQLIGPFVVMIYRMILGDLMRFISIFLVFAIGTTQSFYVLFRTEGALIKSESNSEANTTEVAKRLSDPYDSIISGFVMSVGKFVPYYDTINLLPDCQSVAQLVFYVYLIFSILLIAMLIVMMETTYDEISQAEKENFRQWAKIILLIEANFTPSERLAYQRRYSCLTENSQRAYIHRWYTRPLRETATDTISSPR